jgi:hypothetical protein
MLKPIKGFFQGSLLKTLLCAAFLYGVSSTSHSQLTSLNHQTQVAEYLGDSRFNDLLSSNPSYLDFLDARCTYGYKIVDMPVEKTEGMSVLTSIPMLSWNEIQSEGKTVTDLITTNVSAEDFVLASIETDFNFLRYSITSDKSESKYLVLEGTGKVLIIYSVDYVSNQLNSNN